MAFSYRCLAFAWLPCVFACGDDSPSTGGTADSGDTGATTGVSTTDSSGGDPDTSGGASTTTGGLETTSIGDSSGAASTSSASADGSTTTDGSTSAATTTDGSTSAATTDDGASSTDGTGGGLCEPLPDVDGWPCMVDGDCEIFGDCCNCVAYNPDMGGPGSCGGMCPQDVCEELALDTAVCNGGFCQVLGLSCDQSAVLCDGLPPDCDPGTLPGVADDCWSGDCVPVEYCDWVPDCDSCPGDQICVIVQTDACNQIDCVSPFPECGGGAPTCDCFGEVVCPASHPTCAIVDDVVVCS